MTHDAPLITTIVVGLCLAFLFGIIANRLRISPLVGYLLAGVIVGPHTGGFNADPALTNQLAEIGVILLMFGVGLHFSLKDLLSVKAIAVPGALGQMVFATLLGAGLGWLAGWDIGAALVFGLALSTASTVVLLRSMQERRLLETGRGRIAVGWLIVEDLAMVLVLVLVPALAGAFSTDPIVNWLQLGLWGVIGLTIFKIVLFCLLMLVVGRRVIPWLLKITAQSGSRELFRLGVLAIALGVAFGAAQLFDVSLALGAFFAGMIMSESELSHRAAEESLPLRDAFAVLFFVSVGMLFDPIKLFDNFFLLLATLFIIIIGKSAAAYLIVRAFRYPNSTALTISASLAQIGEFSFILVGIGSSLGLLGAEARDLIVGGAILSILLNPIVFVVADALHQYFERSAYPPLGGQDTIDIMPSVSDEKARSLQIDHTILIGYGRIGKKVARALQQKGEPLVVIEEASRFADQAEGDGLEVIRGNAINQDVMEAANVHKAHQVVIAMRSIIEAGQVVAQARHLKSNLKIIAHALADAETAYLIDLGADIVVTDADEIANGMIEYLAGLRPISKEDLSLFSKEEVENILSMQDEQTKEERREAEVVSTELAVPAEANGDFEDGTATEQRKSE
ncbi:YbaL family putative K(+) efflux transporter [Bartonella sp. DGB2]|uniref:YbaL family putative K(+) efflux transporter n=1 Tax=Bartonella sp. DGB2 TaxID=3388426 RepID=UPI0039903542